MVHRPEIDWQLARRIAARQAGPLPPATRPLALRTVADVRLRARAAGPVAARAMHREADEATTRIRVVDRDGWAEAASSIAESAFDTLRWPRRAAGLRRSLSARGLGMLLGIGLGIAGRWMLGQYDAFGGGRALYLVAPNIVAVETRNRFTPADFRTWVGLHEQAHALQFAAAPWLVGHLTELIDGPQSRASLDRVVATMTFLEGHADHVSDTAGGVPSASAMRRSFAHRPRPRWGILDKGSQYTDGLAFCRAVSRAAGDDALLAVLERPEHLPTRAEIAAPRDWLDRVGG